MDTVSLDKTSKTKTTKKKGTTTTKTTKGTTERGHSTQEKQAPILAQISFEERQNIIAKISFQYAQDRNFEEGHQLEDWLRAEREVDQFLSNA